MIATSNTSENVGIAFAVSCIAGLSTAIGAAVVFVPALVGLANHKTLAGSLAFSAGVMVYLSFVEILSESTDKFVKAGNTTWTASWYSAVCFFSGIILMVILKVIINVLTGGHRHHQTHENESVDDRSSRSTTMELLRREVCPCKVTASEFEDMRHAVQDIQGLQQTQPSQTWEGVSDDEDKEAPAVLRLEEDHVKGRTSSETNLNKENRRHLLLTSISTLLAISLHNFPEGLATFVSTLSDPSVGAVLGIAVMLHNIPEGLCVAMPIFYATGSRWKAFLWATFSGFSEIFAALLAWAVLAAFLTDTMFGIMFAVVGGVMVTISVKELLPAAHRYDPDDDVVNACFIGGMGAMGASLVLLKS